MREQIATDPFTTKSLPFFIAVKAVLFLLTKFPNFILLITVACSGSESRRGGGLGYPLAIYRGGGHSIKKKI